MRCKHCWINAINANVVEYDALFSSEIIETIRTISKLGLEQVAITGGEPFIVREKLYSILSYCSGQGIAIAVETNGTLITEQDVKFLKNVKAQVAISLDSNREEFHDYFRGKQGAFKEAISALKKLVKNRVKNQVIMTVTEDNLNDIEPLADLTLGKIKVDKLKIDPSLSIGRAKRISDSALSFESIPYFVKIIRRVIRKYPNKIFVSLPPAIIGLPIIMAKNAITYWCDYKQLCSIFPNGDVSLCGICLLYTSPSPRDRG